MKGYIGLLRIGIYSSYLKKKIAVVSMKVGLEVLHTLLQRKLANDPPPVNSLMLQISIFRSLCFFSEYNNLTIFELRVFFYLY